MFDWRLGVLEGSDEPPGGAATKFWFKSLVFKSCDGGDVKLEFGTDKVAAGPACIDICNGGTEDGSCEVGNWEFEKFVIFGLDKSDIFGGGLNCSVSSESPSVVFTHFFLSESQTIYFQFYNIKIWIVVIFFLLFR